MIAASNYDTPAFHGYGVQILNVSPIHGIGKPSIRQVERRLRRAVRRRAKFKQMLSRDRRTIFGRSKKGKLRMIAKLNGRINFWILTRRAYKKYGGKRGWMIAKRSYRRWARPRLLHKGRPVRRRRR
jgi:hypothetical protein